MDQAIKDTLGTLLTTLSFSYQEITVEKKDDAICVDIKCEEPSKIIGWHGETLNALQHILKSMLRSMEKLEKAPFILLDTDGYRAMQEEKVRDIARKKLTFVRRTGARVTLAPMSPYFRRVVHTFVATSPEFADCTTESVGEGDYRQVVLRLKDEKARPQQDQEGGEELSPVVDDGADDDLGNLDV